MRGCELSVEDFPSFSEGLSLRPERHRTHPSRDGRFPFLFGGTFIEAVAGVLSVANAILFPFLFGGTFIEALSRMAAGSSL